MKKIFLISAAATALFASIGSLFRSCQWPGGTVMMDVAMVLACVAAILGIISTCQGHLGSKGFSILWIIALLLLVLGAGFRFAHWPGGTMMLIITLGVLIPVGSIWAAVRAWNK